MSQRGQEVVASAVTPPRPATRPPLPPPSSGAWAATVDSVRLVDGYCPMGCGKSLVLSEGGVVFCDDVDCPRPTAASEILGDPETEHIVELGETTFTVRHPLRERLDDQLMECALHRWIAARDEPPEPPGRYRVAVPPGPGGLMYFVPIPVKEWPEVRQAEDDIDAAIAEGQARQRVEDEEKRRLFNDAVG